MRRPLRSVLLLIGTLAFLTFFIVKGSGLGFGAAKGEDDPVRAFAKLERGMTPDQVRKQIGSPKRIARQILYHHSLEQWIYDSPHPARIQFDCPRGQKPQLIWKQALPAENGERGRGANPR
jgi:hypothetical protein